MIFFFYELIQLIYFFRRRVMRNIDHGEADTHAKLKISSFYYKLSRFYFTNLSFLYPCYLLQSGIVFFLNNK